MNQLDRLFLETASEYSNRYPLFDATVVYLHDADLFKGTPLILLLVWFWFADSPIQKDRRATIISLITGCMAVMAVARGLAMLLPYRPRPLYATDFHFNASNYLHVTFEGWSAFPSDHAALFCALAAGIFVLSRPWGIAAFLQVFILALAPRIYLGLHYPTDIAAGAVLGIAGAFCFTRDPVKKFLAPPFFDFEKKHRGLFYAGVFLLGYMFCTMFIEIRDVASGFIHLLKKLIRP